jgi:hypothetical protein
MYSWHQTAVYAFTSPWEEKMCIGADNLRPVFSAVSAWEWACATNLSRLQRETRDREREREREREISKQHVGEAHSVLITPVLLPQRLSCYWCKIVSLHMLTNLRLADMRLTTAQQRSTGQNLPSDLYVFLLLSELTFKGLWPVTKYRWSNSSVNRLMTSNIVAFHLWMA